jgi:hypothetical protein
MNIAGMIDFNQGSFVTIIIAYYSNRIVTGEYYLHCRHPQLNNIQKINFETIHHGTQSLLTQKLNTKVK